MGAQAFYPDGKSDLRGTFLVYALSLSPIYEGH
jgi:hypothetical protein